MLTGQARASIFHEGSLIMAPMPMRKTLLCSSLVATTALSMQLPRSLVVPAASGAHLRTIVMASAVAAENPLLAQSGLPKFGAIDAVHVKPAVADSIASMESSFSTLEAKLGESSDPTYADVIESLEKIEAPVEYAWGVRRLTRTHTPVCGSPRTFAFRRFRSWAT